MSILQSSPSNNFLPANAQNGLLTPLPSSQLIYQLEIKQNPKHSRMSGMGLKAERRPLDPPPIVQLKVYDESERDVTKGMLINNPYFMLQATLTSADGTQDLISLTDNTTGTLLGDTVSSLYPLRDLVNMEGAYFCFANLSVRLEGQYRLKYHLMEMTPEGVQYRTSIYSEPFQVYPPKLFPGVEESTLTSLKYANMGLKLRVRKETRAKKIKLDPQYESEQSNFTPSASSTASSPLHSVATPEPLPEQQSPAVVKHKMSLSFILSCGDNSETINEPKMAPMGNYFQQYQPSAVNQGEFNYYYN